MPVMQQDFTNIKKLQEQAAATMTQGKGIEASSNILGDKVMEAVRADRVSRGVSKLATDTGNVMGQMVSDPQGIRDRTRGMVDPFEVNKLTANARAQNLQTMGTITAQTKLNQASIDEVIQAGANQLKARATQLYAQAQQDAANADALQGEWDRMFKERQFEADEAYRYESLYNKDKNIGDLKITAEEKNSNVDKFTSNERVIRANLEKMGAIDDPEDYKEFTNDLYEEVNSGNITAEDASRRIYNRFKPMEGLNVVPTEEEKSAEKARNKLNEFVSRKAKEEDMIAKGYKKERYGKRGTKVRWVD